MSIKKKTIKEKEETVFEVEFDGHIFDTCYSEKAAKERLKELKLQKIEREKDFVIAEKLENYFWATKYSANHLCHPSYKEEAQKTYMGWTLGKDEKLKIEGFWNQIYYAQDLEHLNRMESPLHYEKPEKFIHLLHVLTSKDLNVIFYSCEDTVGCQIENTNIISETTKEKEWQSLEYFYPIILKELAYLYCKSL